MLTASSAEGQIDLFKIYLYIIRLCAKKQQNIKKQLCKEI